MKRNLNDLIISGVCSGIANHFGIDPLWVRLLFVFFTTVTLGTTLIVYLVLWALM